MHCDCNYNINEYFKLENYDSGNKSDDFGNNFNSKRDKVSEADAKPYIDDFYQEKFQIQ